MTIDDFFRGYSSRLIFLFIFCLCALGILTSKLYYEQVHQGVEHQKRVSRQSIRGIRKPPLRGRIISADSFVLADNKVSYEVLFHINELRKPRVVDTRFNIFEKIEMVTEIIGRTSLLEPNLEKAKNGNTDYQKLLSLALVQRKYLIKRWAKLARKQRESLLSDVDIILSSRIEKNIRDWLIIQKIRKHLSWYPALPLKVFDELTPDELARLSEHMPGIPGVEIAIGSKRIYPNGDICAHLLGYTTRYYPTREEVRQAYFFYPEYDGKRGLELKYEDYLKGEVGFQLVRVDSSGFYQEEMEDGPIGYNDLQKPIEPIHGKDLFLTIDSRAQKAAHWAMQGKRGALVMLDVNTGAVKAMVSAPSYNLNTFRKHYSVISKDTNKPLINRALLADKMPGSIVKPLMALNILLNDVKQHNTIYECIGYYQLGKRRIHCHNRSGHGLLHMLKAIEVSCNPYFIESGLQLGIGNVQSFYEAAGIGQKTGFELHSGKGILPGKSERFPRWIKSDTAFVSMGQGKITVSPLQVAMYTAAIANGGTLYRPYIVNEIRDHSGLLVKKTEPHINNKLPIKQLDLKRIQAGMYKVVHGDDASAPICANLPVKVAGKTGTAELGRGKKNTWFICYGPFENPEFAIAVLVEGGISGGRSAAPVARRFLDRYLRERSEAKNETIQSRID